MANMKLSAHAVSLWGGYHMKLFCVIHCLQLFQSDNLNKRGAITCQMWYMLCNV